MSFQNSSVARDCGEERRSSESEEGKKNGPRGEERGGGGGFYVNKGGKGTLGPLSLPAETGGSNDRGFDWLEGSP